ncbi:MAG TPA: YfbK domain-containing protein, partial [Pirellula sp.]|nr:YfbK domain-containing protein [Pirellula sp.]
EIAQEFQVRAAKDSLSEQASTDFQFASSVLAYGMLLRESQYAGKATWECVISTAKRSTGKDLSGLRAEFVQLAMAASRMGQ